MGESAVNPCLGVGVSTGNVVSSCPDVLSFTFLFKTENRARFPVQGSRCTQSNDESRGHHRSRESFCVKLKFSDGAADEGVLAIFWIFANLPRFIHDTNFDSVFSIAKLDCFIDLDQ